ncbi:MAG: DUF4389 domain-containing protein [Alphaproteobacteria bacterium]
MAEDATDAPEEEAPKKKTTRRKTTPKASDSSKASAGADSSSEDPKEVPPVSAATPEPGASAPPESAPMPAEEAAKPAEAADKEPENEAPASDDRPRPDESKADEPTPGAGAAGAAAATATATQKAKEKIEEVDWGYRGRQLVRGILMVAAGFAATIAMYVIFVIAFVQWVYAMFTKEQMEAAAEFNARLALYIRELLDFIGYRKNDAVFPFAPFPELPDDPVADTTDFDIGVDKKAP